VHAVLDGERDQMGVVHQVARNRRIAKHVGEDSGVCRRLPKGHRHRRPEEIGDRLTRLLDGGRRIEDPMMGDDAQELVEAGPEQTIRGATGAQAFEQITRP
jgi:hypothetical protein